MRMKMGKKTGRKEMRNMRKCVEEEVDIGIDVDIGMHRRWVGGRSGGEGVLGMVNWEGVWWR